MAIRKIAAVYMYFPEELPVLEALLRDWPFAEEVRTVVDDKLRSATEHYGEMVRRGRAHLDALRALPPPNPTQ